MKQPLEVGRSDEATAGEGGGGGGPIRWGEKVPMGLVSAKFYAKGQFITTKRKEAI